MPRPRWRRCHGPTIAPKGAERAMVAYLLDTHHASPLVTRGHPLRGVVHDRAAAEDTFAICVPVLTETLFGISLLPRALQNRAEWARFQPLLPCYSPDEAGGAAAATLQVALRRRGRQLATVGCPDRGDRAPLRSRAAHDRSRLRAARRPGVRELASPNVSALLRCASTAHALAYPSTSTVFHLPQGRN